MSCDPLFRQALPLRVDIDFHTGLTRALPRMLDLLATHRMQASFFVVAGSNRPTASLSRLLDADYRARLAALGPLRVWNALREDRLFSNPRMLEDETACGNLRRIESEGHELVVHGYDHAWWADSVWSAPSERLGHEIDRAFDTIDRIAGANPRAWGSPNWRTRDEVLEMLLLRGVPYLSECWGERPFLTRGTVHLPVTDCLEPWSLERPGEAHSQVVDAMLDQRPSGSYRLICAHDYFEGLIVPELFSVLLDRLAARGLRACTLTSVAAALERDRCREEQLVRGPISGFCGEVSRQPVAGQRMVSSAP